jgi:hypothetical protein
MRHHVVFEIDRWKRYHLAEMISHFYAHRLSQTVCSQMGGLLILIRGGGVLNTQIFANVDLSQANNHAGYRRLP